MPKQITTTVYTLAELKELGDLEAVEAAREWLRQGQCDDSYWHEYTIELWTDALAQIGFTDAKIEFSGFWSQGDGASFTSNVDIEKLVAFFSDAIEPRDVIDGNPEDFRPWLVKQIGDKVTTDEYRRLASIAGHIDAEVRRISHHYSHENTCEFVAGLEVYRDYKRLGGLLDRFIEDAESLRKRLCHAIYKSLEEEYTYQMSDEVIDDTAEANGYTFTKGGEQYD